MSSTVHRARAGWGIALAIGVCVFPGSGGRAHAQPITYVLRNGSAAVSAGSTELGTFTQATRTYTALVETHEDVPILLGSSSARFRVDSVPRPSGIAVTTLGEAGRASLPPPLFSASTNGTDRWRFTVAQASCFSLRARLISASSTASLPQPFAFFNLGVYSGGQFHLSSGSGATTITGSVNGQNSPVVTASGTIDPGTYYFEVGQSVACSGVFVASAYVDVGLSLGAPVQWSAPASTMACPAGPAVVQVDSTGGASTDAHWEVADPAAPGGWRALVDGQNPMPAGSIGGTFLAENTGTTAVRLSGFFAGASGVVPARQTLQVRCALSNACGSTASSAATVTVCKADADCSGSLGVPDIFAFLDQWFASDARADFDGAGGLGVADIFAFLNAWFVGC